MVRELKTHSRLLLTGTPLQVATKGGGYGRGEGLGKVLQKGERGEKQVVVGCVGGGGGSVDDFGADND